MRSFQETARESRNIGVERARRIVLTVFGTLGDLHPFLAIALGLKVRGHQVIVASYGRYREQVETLGLGFHAVRPDLYSQAESDPTLARQVMDQRRGWRPLFGGSWPSSATASTTCQRWHAAQICWFRMP